MARQYIMTQDELHCLQEIEIELLQEVDRICRKCGIHYNMVGGTMLGAIRHGGYIPWDDDADVGFLRKEYEKFREACRTELDTDKFYFQEIRDTDGYRWGYGKLRRKGTKFIRLGQEFMPYEQGIFIDLFPMDNVPDNTVLRKIHFIHCFLLRKFLWSEVGFKVEKNKIIRLLYGVMRLVPRKALIKWYELLVKANTRHKTELVRILTFPAPKGTYGFHRKWFVKQRRYRFSTITLTGARDYEGYLRYKFGNYKELPPEEQRKIHPISELELGRDKLQ
ncbi:MAG: LicD family protein [Roseburia sp.]|nr:LicD family protein [Roseburia sp.]MCM1201668.1 LicD family protein [Bacteroides fragilis]